MAGDKHRQHHAAVAALLTEPTLAAAAGRAGVSERTLRNWLALPAFLSLYREARRQVVEHAVAQLQEATREAVAALRRNLTCGVAYAENGAAKTVLEQSLRAVELLDMQTALEELTRQVEELTRER